MNLAARGARNLDAGIETLQEEDVKAQLRRQARQVYLKALLTAGVLTLLVWIIPHR